MKKRRDTFIALSTLAGGLSGLGDLIRAQGGHGTLVGPGARSLPGGYRALTGARATPPCRAE